MIIMGTNEMALFISSPYNESGVIYSICVAFVDNNSTIVELVTTYVAAVTNNE